MPTHDPRHEENVLTETRETVKRPPMYRVLLHNDDYTTMDFVVYVLVTIFHHSEDNAFRIMLQVHTQGIGIAGVYTYEVAEMKVAKVSRLAREREFPLLCTMEEE